MLFAIKYDCVFFNANGILTLADEENGICVCVEEIHIYDLSTILTLVLSS